MTWHHKGISRSDLLSPSLQGRIKHLWRSPELSSSLFHHHCLIVPHTLVFKYFDLQEQALDNANCHKDLEAILQTHPASFPPSPSLLLLYYYISLNQTSSPRTVSIPQPPNACSIFPSPCYPPYLCFLLHTPHPPDFPSCTHPPHAVKDAAENGAELEWKI